MIKHRGVEYYFGPSKTTNMNKIYIAVPTSDGSIYFELSLRLAKWNYQKDIRTTVVYHPFLSPVDHARNTIVKNFLETNCTHLMMVDDDIVPPEEAVEKLLSHDKDIVAAACPLISPDKTGKLVTSINAYNLDEDDMYSGVELTGIQKVDAVGTGCIMIKRKVLERLKVPPFITEYTSNGIKYRGEDINFCYQASLIGYDTYVDFDLKCKHIKQCNLLEL